MLLPILQIRFPAFRCGVDCGPVGPFAINTKATSTSNEPALEFVIAKQMRTGHGEKGLAHLVREH